MRILIVDDDIDTLNLASRCLSLVGGHTVERATNAPECLASATAFKPEAILLDYMLEGMDGIMVFELLRGTAEVRDIPVIFFTSSQDVDTLERLHALSPRGLIRKPIDPETLCDQIDKLMQPGN